VQIPLFVLSPSRGFGMMVRHEIVDGYAGHGIPATFLYVDEPQHVVENKITCSDPNQSPGDRAEEHE
jgi:hypothetical protein